MILIKKKMRLFILFFVLLFFGSLSYAQLLFKEEAGLVGLDETCGVTYLGNGVSFVDYNDDGWDDVTITTSFGQQVRFFKNTNGIFTEEYLSIPNNNYQTKQVNWVDYDNDGDKDLFLTSDFNGNRLFENTGSLNFVDVTSQAGLPLDNLHTFGASWGDINNDSYLDIFISNRHADQIITNKLYRNNGDGTFSDITVSAGVDDSELSFCAAFFDYNNDGYQDIYVSNDKFQTENLLYKNNGDETFDDVSQLSETNVSFDAMTTTIGDYNNDGWFDIYVTNSPPGNALLKNNGDGTFTDVADITGTGFYSLGWGAVFLDAENDMDLDLYVSGSLDGTIPGLISAAFYEQTAPETFVIPSAGFDDDTGASYSNAIGDINNDGLPEIVVTNDLDEDLFLWNNLTTTSNNWLKVKLEGTASNRDGIGSVLELGINGGKYFRYTHCGEGYLAQNSTAEFFGMGTNTTADYLKVTWLSGIVDYFYNVSANQVLEITEGSGTLSINNPNVTNNISIFPNPVKNTLNIKSSSPIESLTVVNLIGQQVLFKEGRNAMEMALDMSNLSSGTYFIKLNSESHSEVHKIVKN